MATRKTVMPYTHGENRQPKKAYVNFVAGGSIPVVTTKKPASMKKRTKSK